MLRYARKAAEEALPPMGSVTGGDAMVTYAELFQYSLVIIGVITLCFLHKN